MQFTVEYDDGVWIFNVSSDGEESDYVEEFEITNLADAKAAAFELIEEIMEMAEAEDEDEDDPFAEFLKDLDA